MSYYSKFYQVEVRDSIAKEFMNPRGEVDDMMAGLHEIRVRMTEKAKKPQTVKKAIKKSA